MIRKRDLIVFIVVLFVLLLCIAVTLVAGSVKVSPTGVLFTGDEAPQEFTAQAPQNDLNREDIISRLRNALAQNQSDIEPQPSVEEDAVEETQTMGEVDEPTGVDRCGGADDALAYVKSWPLAGVGVEQQGGVRTVVHTQQITGVPLPYASSTASSTQGQTRTVLLTLPTSPYATGETHCVPSDVIGVTTSGSLMFNSDAAFYRGYGTEYLIGYARDGYPIYGYYEGTLDSCGGYMHPSGYRYSVSASKDHLLSCYTATPASFTGL